MKQLILSLLICLITGCGKIDRPNIPLTEKEISFFEELNNNPLAIDSVTRSIEIGSLMFYVFDKIVYVNIYSYSTEDSLTVKERDLLSDKIASFYSTETVEKIKFISCSINYFRSETQNSKDYFYRYDIDNNAIILKSRSYELEKEAQQSDSLKYSTD